MKKILLSIVLIILLFGFSFSNDIVCGGVDKKISEIDLIISDILILLKKDLKTNHNVNIDFDYKNLSTQQSFSQINQGNISNLNQSLNNQVNQLTNNLSNLPSQSFSYGGSIFYSFLTTIVDSIDSSFSIISVILGPEEKVNDYKYLLDMTDKIRNTIIYLGKKGYFFNTVSDNTKKQIIKKFSDKNLLVRFNLNPNKNMTYGDVLNLMFILTYTYKKIVLNASKYDYNTLSSFLQNICKDNSSDKKFCTFLEDGLSIVLDKNSYNLLRLRYKTCPDKKISFSDRLNNIVGFFSNQTENSYKRWKRALDKLDKALEGGVLNREKPLIDIHSNVSLKDLAKNVDSLEKKGGEVIKDLEEIRTNKFIEIDYENDKILKERLSDVIINTNKQMFKEQINNIFNQISLIEKGFFNDLIIQDITILTRKYRILSETIHKNIALIGDKGQKGTIINSLGEACQKQCSNVGGICWYF